MNKRPIDKTKKSNIKCGHCEYYSERDWSGWCREKVYTTNCWNRCKKFDWASRLDYRGE